MNLYVFFIVCIPFLIAIWIYSSPIEALKDVVNLRLRFREYLVKRYGNSLADVSDDRLREYGRRKNIPEAIVEEAILNTRHKSVERLGRNYVDKNFPKTPVEDFFT